MRTFGGNSPANSLSSFTNLDPTSLYESQQQPIGLRPILKGRKININSIEGGFNRYNFKNIMPGIFCIKI
jgi:hypothetical protein